MHKQRRFNRFATTIFTAGATTLLISCGLNQSEEGPNVLGGSPDVPIGSPGNFVTLGAIKVGDAYYDVPCTARVLSNTNGKARIKLTADLSAEPNLALINGWIPPERKDAKGAINTEFDIKITSEGMQSFFKGEEPHTLVKFDAQVGDQYVMKRPDGETYTRKVVERTGLNDFPYGFMNIKTIAVEQTTKNAPMGVSMIKKVTFRANHKFGIVYLKLEAEDGDTASAYLYSERTN